jgi:DNA-binding transcriptional LysR family regulator
MLTLARVRVLNAVIETGGIASAARLLGISQPAVTQSLKDLERAANTQLFERKGQEWVPTSICVELARLTARITASHRDAELLLEAHAKLAAGELRIGLGNAMPGMALIRSFRQKFPGVTIEVEMGNWRQIIESVAAQRVDVGVLPNVPDDGRFLRATCLTQSIVALTPQTWDIDASASLTCAELTHFPLVFRTKGSSTQRLVDQAFHKARLQPKPTLVLDSREGVYEAVANGLGIGFMWRAGTSRADGIRKHTIAELVGDHPEHIFYLTGSTNPLAKAFAALSSPT